MDRRSHPSVRFSYFDRIQPRNYNRPTSKQNTRHATHTNIQLPTQALRRLKCIRTRYGNQAASKTTDTRGRERKRESNDTLSESALQEQGTYRFNCQHVCYTNVQDEPKETVAIRMHSV